MSAITTLQGGNGVIEVLVPGPQGIQGNPGAGVPAGGTTGQALLKASGADRDTAWVDLPADRPLASQAQAEAGSDGAVVMTPLAASQHFAARLVNDLTSTSTTTALSAAQGKALQDGKVTTSRTITAGTGLSGGGSLSADRTISADLASQVEAEAGSSSVKLMTPLRVKNAIDSRLYNGLDSTSTSLVLTAAQGKALQDGKASSSRQIVAGTGLSGGGNLSADRTLSVSFASEAEAQAGTESWKAMSPATTSAAITSRVVNSLASTSTTSALSAAQGRALQDGKAAATRAITAGTGLTGGGDLSADRSLAVDFASQAEAEGGSSTAKVMSPLRVAQAIAALAPSGLVANSRTITAGTGLTGGGDLSADRTLSISIASQAEAEALASNVKVMTPLATGYAIASKADKATTITASTGLTGGGSLAANRTLALTGQALALHNLATSGLISRTGAGTVAARTLAGSSGITISNGDGVSGDPTVAPTYATQGEAEAGAAPDVLMSPLRVAQAIASRLYNGLDSSSSSLALTAAQGKALQDGKAATTRTITAGTGLTGGGDLSADRSFALTGQALALHNLATSGLITRTGAGTVAGRTITGANGIAVTNGDGVSGNPSVAPTYATQGEAEAGSATTVLMSPLRVAQAIAALPSLAVTVSASGKALGKRELCVVTGSGQTFTLPATPSAGDVAGVSIAGTFTDTVLARNSSKIMGLAEDMTIDRPNVTVLLTFVDATHGWRIS